MSKIPSEDEFARAKKKMRELDRNIIQVNENALRYFKEICPTRSHNFYLIAEERRKFRAYVFYKSDKDIQIYKANGIAQKIEDFVYAELERQERGKKEELTLSFEFDSDENIAANYDGDYLLRLR